MPIQGITQYTFIGHIHIKHSDAASLAGIEPKYRSVGELVGDLCRAPTAKPFRMFNERLLSSVNNFARNQRDTLLCIAGLPSRERHGGGFLAGWEPRARTDCCTLPGDGRAASSLPAPPTTIVAPVGK
jgi:hypothetical protein